MITTKDIDNEQLKRKIEFAEIMRGLTLQRTELDAEFIENLLRLCWYNRSNVEYKPSPTWREYLESIQKQVPEPYYSQLEKRGYGFTAFYSAYRPSVTSWVKKHERILRDLVKTCLHFKDDDERIAVALKIESLAKIPGVGKGSKSSMHAESLITPLLFILDPDKRFPVINGRDAVQYLIKAISGATETHTIVRDHLQFQDKFNLSAFQLDSLYEDWKPTFKFKTKSNIAEQLLPLVDENMPLMDIADINYFKTASMVTVTQRHNNLTNLFKKSVGPDFFATITKKLPIDIIVKGKDTSDRLIIEAKGTTETTEIRMALGQLYHYHYKLMSLKPGYKAHLCILLPEKPTKEILDFLKWMNISLIFPTNGKLEFFGTKETAVFKTLFKKTDIK